MSFALPCPTRGFNSSTGFKTWGNDTWHKRNMAHQIRTKSAHMRFGRGAKHGQAQDVEKPEGMKYGSRQSLRSCGAWYQHFFGISKKKQPWFAKCC